MKREIKNNLYDINDKISVNALSVVFSGKLGYDEIKNNLQNLLKQIPLTCSKLEIINDKVLLIENENPVVNLDEVKQSDKNWISKQFEKPLDLFNGEFIRFALVGENTFVIYAHPLLSDSRGLLAFAKAVLDSSYEYNSDSFYFPSIEEVKISLIQKFKINSLKKSKTKERIDKKCSSIKVKNVSLKSKIVYSLCSSEGVSTLSFFIVTALSLSKIDRKKINIPYCKKDNFDDLLINDSPLFSFKRGLDTRLSFYDNCQQVDKFFVSIKNKKSYEKRQLILSKFGKDLLNYPVVNERLEKFISCDMQYDLLPEIHEDPIIKNMNYYSSSSYVSNIFGICSVDDRITISSILHDEKGEKLFSDYQSTINLLAKNAAKKFKELR